MKKLGDESMDKAQRIRILKDYLASIIKFMDESFYEPAKGCGRINWLIEEKDAAGEVVDRHAASVGKTVAT
jgi:hypothetical protein